MQAYPADETSDNLDLPVAVLEHLTGPGRGTVSWLGDDGLEVSLDSQRRLRVRRSKPDSPSEGAIALLHRMGRGFDLETLPGKSVWVNRRPVTQKRLTHHDTIEFGEAGPMSRYCLCANRQPISRSFPYLLNDLAAYLRSSRKPLVARMANAGFIALRRLTVQTTVVYRVSVVVAIAALGFISYQQAQMNALLGERISTGAAQLEHFSRTLAQSREEAITPAALEALRLDMAGRMETAANRLARLERRSTASARIIRESAASVLMVQSAYGFSDRETGRMLRQVVGPDGKPQLLPNGLLMLTLEGDGPVAERQFIGTAFAIDDGSILVTNRHVGIPWERDAVATNFSSRGLEPKLLDIVAFAPGHSEPIPASLDRASDTDDLALLRLSSVPATVVGLELAEEPADPGTEIIVMGYPTGLRSLLAQAGQDFVEALQQSGDVEFWSIARRLAKAGKIVPLASRGIVGRIGTETLVYDAETTHGGSGGPVFDIDGKVIAVNTAILPEYGGSNLGIPAERVRQLLTASDEEG